MHLNSDSDGAETELRMKVKHMEALTDVIQFSLFLKREVIEWCVQTDMNPPRVSALWFPSGSSNPTAYAGSLFFQTEQEATVFKLRWY